MGRTRPGKGRALLRRVAVLLFSVAFACLGRIAVAAEEEETEKVEPADMQARVKVVKPRPGELPIQLHTLGTVAARQQIPAAICCIVTGIVRTVEVRDGQEVTSGTLLVRLDDRSFRQALAKTEGASRAARSDLQMALDGGLDAKQADADLAAAQAAITAKQAQREAERQAALFKDQMASEKAATEARQTADAAERAAKATAEKARIYRESGRALELARLRATVEQAEADVRSANLNLDATLMLAPGDGRVSHLSAVVGRSVAVGDMMAQVVGRSMLVVRAGLVPASAGNVRIGAPVQVAFQRVATEHEDSATTEAAGPDAHAANPTTATVAREMVTTGTVRSIGGGVEPDTGLVPIEVTLNPAASPAPRIGETAFVHITTRTSARGLLVPVSALVINEDTATIVVVDDKQIAHVTPVHLYARSAEEAVIAADGVTSGSLVVVEGNFNLPDGAHVVVEPSK